MNGNNRGFTLIELLTVTVILGVLAVMAVPRIAPARDRAVRATMVSDLRNVSAKQEVFFQSHSTYTDDLEALEFRPSPGVVITVTEIGTQGWAATAEHPTLGGEQCGIFVGRADPANGSPATAAGAVACTS